MCIEKELQINFHRYYKYRMLVVTYEHNNT